MSIDIIMYESQQFCHCNYAMSQVYQHAVDYALASAHSPLRP